MIIIEDTRQQAAKHELKHACFNKDGDRLLRSKLLIGDYALPPSVAVDTKKGISEIAANICGSVSEKKRFQNECKLAHETNCKLVVLIEDKKIHSIDDLWGKSVWIMAGRSIPGNQLATAMNTLSARYGIQFVFCPPEKSASYIKQIFADEENGGK